MIPLYPLKFKPIAKEKIWGGQKLGSILKKEISHLENCGETWEISGVEGNISVVDQGPLVGETLPELISTYGDRLVGATVKEKYGLNFPLLVKFIDADQDLSIQVHPDDHLARSRGELNGKTEMWYIFQADEGSELICGFNRPVQAVEYLERLHQGSLMEILNREKVEPGDAFFIPAGRVHTIGRGLLLAEIQQTSDLTYRIYDFDRVDKQGQKRELHTEQALEAIDFTFYPEYKTEYDPLINREALLADCEYFTVNRLYFNQQTSRDYTSIDSFVIYVCTAGQLEIHWDHQFITVGKGEAILLPAVIKSLLLIPKDEFTLLEAFVPSSS